MRTFDWLALFRAKRVPYIERGPNVKRGEINIRCPFCGSADPSFHMGINLNNGWFSCWRNRTQHSGKSPLRLIIRLLGVTYGQAREIAGLNDDYVDPEGFDAMAAKLMLRDLTTGRKEEVKRRTLQLDDGFQPIERRARTRMHWSYLVESRGFDDDSIEELGRLYGVCAGVGGDWAARIILPYYQDKDLVTWTARAVGTSTMRYRDLSRDESVLPPKETLFNHDAILEGGEMLVIVEGPMDALKLDYYGRGQGVRAVALSTNSTTSQQAFLLQVAPAKFKRVVIMMDEQGFGLVDSMRMRSELAFIPDLGIAKVPYRAKDAADLTPAQIETWALNNT